MSLHRWLVLVGGVILVVILFNLPKVVVDNDSNDTTLVDSSEEIDASHEFSFGKEAESQANRYLNSINTSSSNEKSIIFADSLARLYLSYNMIDSAGKYVDLMLSVDSIDISNIKRTGELYFQIFGIALNQSIARVYAEKSGACFEKFLESKQNPDIKAKLAVTKVASENPMQGILMLRDILKKYPNNVTAIFNLGVLSMQSGQYDKAVERFEKLMTLDSTNDQGAYYLAVSHYELGDLKASVKWFQKIKSISNDPAILSSSEQYLNKINEF